MNVNYCEVLLDMILPWQIWNESETEKYMARKNETVHSLNGDRGRERRLIFCDLWWNKTNGMKENALNIRNVGRQWKLINCKLDCFPNFQNLEVHCTEYSTLVIQTQVLVTDQEDKLHHWLHLTPFGLKNRQYYERFISLSTFPA